MIPKIIHYCWFGGKEKSKEINKYIEIWKEKMPDYKIIEWNEANFDVSSNVYVQEAYNMKKFAFVSDYVRLKALYDYGGIYFDTDIEVLKNFEDVLKKDKCIFGFELENKIMTGVMISPPGSDIIKEFIENYKDRKFIDESGVMDLTPNTTIFTQILTNRGLELNNEEQEFSDFIVYPIEFFTGFDLKNNCVLKTENTRTIHHYNYTWANKKQKIKQKLKRIFSKIVGKKFYNKIRILKNRVRNK